MSGSNPCVSFEQKDGIGIIRLGGGTADAAVDKVPVLNAPRMEQLKAILVQVRSNTSLKGLVIIGSAGGAFCAGADLNALNGVSDAKHGEKLAKQGQDIFEIIERLPITTVAAISGPCVGGGCELVLSCNYRIATGSSATRIGLPEINLGILPGFGGTQRLPRLIGLPAALDIILAGKVIAAKQARKVGLVDEVIGGEGDSFAELEKTALKIAAGQHKPQRKGISISDRLLTFTGIGRNIVAGQSKKQIWKATKGNYPAPTRALDIAILGLSKGTQAGYAEEAVALGELAVTSVAKSLIHVFFLTEAAKKLGRGAKDELKDLSVAVIGAGVMGQGIASSFLHKGVTVELVDPAAPALEKARQHIKDGIDKRRSMSEEQKAKCMSQLLLRSDVSQVKSANFFIEAATENGELKQKIFAGIEAIASDTAFIASNTSSIPITDLSSGLKRPERFIGMHFFNPVEKMPLVEIIRGRNTNERSLIATAALTSRLGKHPVVVEDVSGFLVNRTLTPYLVEAAILLSEGYSETDIDKAATDFGMPMGPIRLLDEVGLDVVSKVSDIIEKAYGERMKGPHYAEILVQKGRLGRKSGAGFYQYQGKDHQLDPALSEMLNLPEGNALAVTDRGFIRDRLIMRLVNEAVLCLDEGVAGNPGAEAAGQVDLASVMGIGFPPFRGGIIFYAESLGAKAIYAKLMELADAHGSRFMPSAGIKSRAEKGGGFYK